MKPLHIKGTEYSPEVVFNPDAALYVISGESRPEDAGKLYGTVLNWLDDFFLENIKSKKPISEITFQFKLVYFNTVSAKYILEVLRVLQNNQGKGVVIKVQWYYKPIDEDIKDSGEEYARLVNVPLEFIKI
ncbi:MAG: DUF1987 domain-containing protein [Bacteroidia bacterium]